MGVGNGHDLLLNEQIPLRMCMHGAIKLLDAHTTIIESIPACQLY